uniref:Uncharacterized protein n=1 Tax=Rhodosorus marinus TaxID=101924 RepID=A0A7S0G364_9RHOD|mmetsp:Transcript_14924/g.21967  ORF Transcript_14924/g.21967 Transcript_14924/m.21967 type:complete len:135 (+) Transcript_14924:236-640(+)
MDYLLELDFLPDLLSSFSAKVTSSEVTRITDLEMVDDERPNAEDKISPLKKDLNEIEVRVMKARKSGRSLNLLDMDNDLNRLKEISRTVEELSRHYSHRKVCLEEERLDLEEMQLELRSPQPKDLKPGFEVLPF